MEGVLETFFGHYICFNPLGQSTVDCLLASQNIIKQILYFKVSDFIPILSDCHCKITWEMLAKYPNSATPKTENLLRRVPMNYTWVEGSDLRFQETLSTPEIQNKIDNFMNRSNSCSVEEISETICHFENISLSAADMSLKKPSVKKKKNKNKKWFNTDLGKLRARVVSQGILYSRYHMDPIVRGRYYKLYGEYNKLRKMKYRKFTNAIINKLDSLMTKDPKQYWKLVNDLKAGKADPASRSVDPDTWKKHFQTLHSVVDQKFENRLRNLELLLSEKEKNILYFY